MKLHHRITGIAAATAVASGLVVGVPGTANAGAYGCSGKFIRSWPVTTSWVTLSDIRLYYNSSTGWSCAVNVKRKAYKSKKTSVWIHMMNSRANDTDKAGPSYVDSENGKFKWYAGPIRVKGKMGGKKLKVSLVGETYWDGSRAYRRTPFVNAY
jgi:hypothetical protein